MRKLTLPLMVTAMAVLPRFLFAQSAGAPPTDTLSFFKEQTARRYDRVPRKTLAFYYTWYATPKFWTAWSHWKNVDPVKKDILTSRHYPVKGAYDSLDPAIIDYHIDLAKQCGIDAFITTWWGKGTLHDKAVNKLLDAAAKKRFEATVYWETMVHPQKTLVEGAVEDLLYVLRTYGSHPAFLKVDGKPVIFVYGRAMNQAKTGDWAQIIQTARAQYEKDFLLIADGYKETNARVFDGLHTYNICRDAAGKTLDEIRAIEHKNYAVAVALARSHGKISCLTVIPGFDNSKNKKPGIVADRHDGKMYPLLWEEAVAAEPDWILITSWNEWHEGSEIEPSAEMGDRYIQMTAQYAPAFGKKPPSVSRPSAGKGLSPDKIAELQRLYKGKTIGILPGEIGGGALWLVDAGIDVKALTDEQMLDPAVFNARRFPLVINCGGESYRQTVKEKGDCDRAIIRYLNEGGLLMAMTSLPLPFYANEEKEKVGSARQFGFPIRGKAETGGEARSWEKPPEGKKLTFAIDKTALPGLPASIAFPENGDLRWRPCVKEPNAGDDGYLPLATLKDQDGGEYGNAIAYIEHKSTPPKNGKNLYVWMRMSDLLGANDLCFDLFRFAVSKMNSH